MMDNRPAFLWTRFGRADIQAPINLHGVGGNDLTAKLPSQIETKLGFPHSRGTQNDKNLLLYHKISLLSTAKSPAKLMVLQANNDGASVGTGEWVFGLGEPVKECPDHVFVQVLPCFYCPFTGQGNQGLLLLGRCFL